MEERLTRAPTEAKRDRRRPYDRVIRAGAAALAARRPRRVTDAVRSGQRSSTSAGLAATRRAPTVVPVQ